MQNLRKEEWKDIPWYEWLYKISDLWNVKSLNYNSTGKEKVLKPLNINGYSRVVLVKNKVKSNYKIHRLVAQAFLNLDIKNTKILVCHKSEILNQNWLLNNELQNIFLWSAKENTKDMIVKKRNPTTRVKWKNHIQSIMVNQYNINWEFIKTWGCIREIERELWIYSANVWKCCNWIRKKTWWFVWQYFTS